MVSMCCLKAKTIWKIGTNEENVFRFPGANQPYISDSFCTIQKALRGSAFLSLGRCDVKRRLFGKCRLIFENNVMRAAFYYTDG